MEIHQKEIPFEWIEKELTIKRSRFRREANRHFSVIQANIYERLVFDLTHKDFEYFLCYILEKELGDKFRPYVVDKKLDQKWVDVVYEDGDMKHFFQCKQWSSNYMDIKQVGASYAKLYIQKKLFPWSSIHFVSTSFLKKDSENFLKDHHVEYYSNMRIVKLAIKYHLDIKENWIKLIKYIESKRLELYSQQRLPIGINDFQRLLEERLIEDAMHTKSFKQCEKVLLPSSNSVIFKSFIEWWTLN